jgi:hypothetical protein
MNTFSKSLAPSLRISYMVLPPRLMQQYRDNLNFYSCSVPALEQYTLARFLEGGYFERHLNRVKGFYREHRKHVLAALAASPLSRLATVEESPAGTHLLLYICTELAPEDVRQRARERGIDLTFYSDYFLPGTKLPENGCRGQKVAIVPELRRPAAGSGGGCRRPSGRHFCRREEAIHPGEIKGNIRHDSNCLKVGMSLARPHSLRYNELVKS